MKVIVSILLYHFLRKHKKVCVVRIAQTGLCILRYTDSPRKIKIIHCKHIIISPFGEL